MIEMIAQLIGGILKLIKTGDLNRASQDLQSAYRLAFQHDSLKLKDIPEKNLIDSLLQEYHYTTGHLEMLAELFYTEAELLMAEKKETDSLLFYRKSLSLYEYIDKDYSAYSQERQDKIQAIRERLAKKV
jgi:hypothetical protein